jgi:hypothetical protein
LKIIFIVLKKLQAIALFYKSFCLVSLLMTAICLFLFWESGYHIYAVLLWLKLSSVFCIYRFIDTYKSKEFYYYRNLGISKRVLWIVSLSFDLALYLLLIPRINTLR